MGHVGRARANERKKREIEKEKADGQIDKSVRMTNSGLRARFVRDLSSGGRERRNSELRRFCIVWSIERRLYSAERENTRTCNRDSRFTMRANLACAAGIRWIRDASARFRLCEPGFSDGFQKGARFARESRPFVNPKRRANSRLSRSRPSGRHKGTQMTVEGHRGRTTERIAL